MKKLINMKFKFIITFIFILIFILMSFNIKILAKTDPRNNLTFDQMKAQILLFNQALKEFGVSTPVQAADIWARGFKERNGVMQYSVLCDNLKKDWIDKMGIPENSYWNIGVSSPWLDSYDVTKNKKINNDTYKITIKLHWVASGNYSTYEEKTLTIVNKNNKWCIKAISDFDMLPL